MKQKTNHNDLVNNNYTNLPLPTFLLRKKNRKNINVKYKQYDSNYTFKRIIISEILYSCF